MTRIYASIHTCTLYMYMYTCTHSCTHIHTLYTHMHNTHTHTHIQIHTLYTRTCTQVSINEPLSFLQRMVEDLIYADSLSSAVSSSSTLEELAYVAAFACSVYAQTSSNTRMTKPFNPMLGETYECDRRAESGWRCLLEQVLYTCT